MKLLFPNGEHPQVLLGHGVNKIGSSPDAAIVIARPGVQPIHCEIHVVGAGCNLQIPVGSSGIVTVNNKPVRDMISLRAGDLIMIGSVQAKFAKIESTPGSSSAPLVQQEPPQDHGATRVRAAIPRYVVRGVSGSLFGKVFPIKGPTTIGRTSDCDIVIDTDEVSRRHALLKPTSQGLSVEDLGSSNGTFINNQRVQQAFLNPGDELRIDTIRLVLASAGNAVQSMGAQGQADLASGEASTKSKSKAFIVITIAILVVVVAITMYMQQSA